ncbi:MAG: Thioredoxin [Chlamydiales bacterium]|nr:Thioredoxin [Chlamydiales bacterium]MCH9619748.1 Thioredoxin [Chlamydiales bacterium]MCH9623354.1 Thioredoxin [Chlamydiales bacterium]
MAASNLIKVLNDDNFDENVASGTVLVDFYADWCGPCRMLTPIVEELAQEMTGDLVVAKVDTDQSVNVASKFEVTSIPTLILFKNGQVVKRVVGLKDLDALRKMVQEVL